MSRLLAVAATACFVAVMMTGSGSASGPDDTNQLDFAPFTKPVLVSGTQPVFGEWHMAAHTNGNIVLGWIDVQSGVGCGFTVSEDDGKTWSAPDIMKASANSGGDPVIAFDAQGNTYRSCILTPTGGLPDGTYFQKSTDGGLTWGDMSRRIVPFDDYQWQAADAGTVWEVFNNGGTGLRISTDDGVTWGQSKTLNSGWPSCIQFVDGVLYGFSGQEGEAIEFWTSSDRGITVQSKAIGSLKGGGRGECAVDSKRGDIYFVFPQSGIGNTGKGPSTAVQLLRSKDLGATWDPPVVVFDPQTTSDYASVALDAAGNLHASWMDIRGGFPQAYYSNSTDFGNTWTVPLKVSEHTAQGGAQYIHYGKGIAVTPRGFVCISFPASASTSSSTGMFVSCSKAAAPAAQLSRIDVTPVMVTITADQSQPFAAQAFDQNGQPMSGVTSTWSSSDGSVDPSGLYTPQKTGVHSVSATASGKSGSAQVTVTPGTAVSVSIDPPQATITADETKLFTAAGQDAKGNPVTSFTWVASDGTVSTSGLFAPIKVGQWQVTASSGGKNAVAQVFVTPGRLASLTVAPDLTTIAADTTLQFTASGKDSKGNEVSVSPTWTVEEGAIDARGLFTPQRTGTWSVSAAQDGLSDVVQVTVVPGAIHVLTIAPQAVTLDNGQRIEFALHAEDVKGNEIPLGYGEVVWEQVGGRVGKLDDHGVLVADMPGSVTVRATMSYGGATKSADSRVTVHWLLLYALLIALAIVATLGIGLARRRKKRRQREQARTAQWGQWPQEQWPQEQWPPN